MGAVELEKNCENVAVEPIEITAPGTVEDQVPFLGNDERLKHEIEYGKYLASLDHGEFWYWSSAAGQIRLKRRKRILTEGIIPTMKILELGCGSGYFTEALGDTGAHITSIDISPDLLRIARKKASHPNVNLKQENAYDLQYEDATFDKVVGNSILHHLDIELAVECTYRVLKSGGQIKFFEPNIMNPLQLMELYIPYMRKASRHSPDETAINRWKMKKLLEKYGFVNVKISAFDFLHPNTPESLIPFIKRLGHIAEKTPLLSEISGSLLITAEKP